MPAHPFQTSFGWCQILWENETLLGFDLLIPPPESNASGSADKIIPKNWIQLLSARVVLHLDGDPQDFRDAPYAFARATPFQAAVYRAALTVPAGQTRTYGWLAAQLNRPPGASRAIGAALGQNPWPLLVPCHRFLSARGKMTGFSAPGGIATKHRLLALERAELPLA